MRITHVSNPTQTTVEASFQDSLRDFLDDTFWSYLLNMAVVVACRLWVAEFCIRRINLSFPSDA